MAASAPVLPSISPLSGKDSQAYTSHDHLHAHHGHGHHDDHDHLIINPIDDHRSVPASPLMGTHTPPSEHEDDAILSDIPSDSEAELEIPPSSPITERRHRYATSVSSDDFEFPIFLGRQADDTAAVICNTVENIAPARKTSSKPSAGTAAAPTLAAEQHASSLSGPMMSWWPSPLDTTECDFPIFLGRQAESSIPRTISTQSCKSVYKTKKTSDAMYQKPIDNLSGPEMFWWPSSMDASGFESEALVNTWWRTPVASHDWNEKFYE